MENTYFDETIRPGVLNAAGKHLIITDEKIEYADKSINTREVEQVAETLTRVKTATGTLGDTFQFELKDKKGKLLNIGLSSFLNPTDTATTYARIHDALKTAIYERLAAALDHEINAGTCPKKGSFVFKKEGIEITEGLIFKSKKMILWKDLKTDVSNGCLYLRSEKDTKIKGELFLHWWNALIFRMVIEKRTGGF